MTSWSFRARVIVTVVVVPLPVLLLLSLLVSDGRIRAFQLFLVLLTGGLAGWMLREVWTRSADAELEDARAARVENLLRRAITDENEPRAPLSEREPPRRW